MGIPLYTTGTVGKIYSCSPDNSSSQYEVHVLAVYVVPNAGNARVNIISRGKSNRPIVLVLVSYEPVKWILNIPSDITISKIILVSTKSFQNLLRPYEIVQGLVRVLLCYCKDIPMFLQDLSNILENLDNIMHGSKFFNGLLNTS